MTKRKTSQWVFISKTRRWCFSISIVVLLITLLQTLTGKYSDSIVWVWLLDLILIIPILVLLWINWNLRRFSGRIVSKTTHRIFVWGTIVYYLLILMAILSEPLLMHTYGWSGSQIRIQSFFFLFPIEIILLLLYWLLFYKGKFQLIQDQNLLTEFIDQAGGELLDSQDDFVQLQKRCHDLIATNNLGEACQHMREFFENHHQRKVKDIVLLQRQFNESSYHFKMGLATYEQVQVVNNRIAFAILEILD